MLQNICLFVKKSWKNASQFPQNINIYNINIKVLINKNMIIKHQLSNRMISEGSCDTEDWSNDAEISASHFRRILHFKIHQNRQQLF